MRYIEAAVRNNSDGALELIARECFIDPDCFFLGVGCDINCLRTIDPGQIAGDLVGDSVVEQVDENPDRPIERDRTRVAKSVIDPPLPDIH